MSGKQRKNIDESLSRMRKNSSIDDRLRELERDFEFDPQNTNLEQKIIHLRQRLGIRPHRTIFFSQGWQAQTKVGHHWFSSVTTLHGGWWGIDHIVWSDEHGSDIVNLGEHYWGLEKDGKPSKDAVIKAHLQMLRKFEKPDETLRYKPWQWED